MAITIGCPTQSRNLTTKNSEKHSTSFPIRTAGSYAKETANKATADLTAKFETAAENTGLAYTLNVNNFHAAK